MKAALAAALIAFAPLIATAQPAAPASDLDRGTQLRREDRPAQAIPYLEAATRSHPQDADAWLELGLAYAGSERLDEAQAALDRAAGLAPAYADVQIARARVAYFRSDPAEARRRLASVLAQHPDNAEAKALDRQIAAALAAGVAPWRVDLAYTHGHLSRGLPSAEVVNLSLVHRFSGGRFAGANFDRTRQFGQTDTYGEVVAGARRGYLAAGGAPDAHFRPRWAVRGGLYADAMRPAGWTVQPLIDVGWSRYPVGDVRSITPGLDLARGEALALRARWINVIDEHDRRRAGQAEAGDWRPAKAGPLGVTAALANAPESSDGATQRVKSLSGGVILDLGARTTVRLIANRESRPAYRRHDLTVSVTRGF